MYLYKVNRCILALVEKTKVDYNDIGHITCGTVIQESKTSNIAREAALTAGFPDSVSGQKFLCKNSHFLNEF